jgi:hypothetical protein
MAKTKKPKVKKPRRVYTVTKKNWRGVVEESKKIYKRKHDAAVDASIHDGFITEYELVKTEDLLIIGQKGQIEGYVPRTPEAELLYGKT